MKIFKLNFFICQGVNKKYFKTSGDWICYGKQAKIILKTTKFPLFSIWMMLFGLSLILSSRVIPDHISTVFSKHRWIPLSLISFIHSCNVLVELFPILITSPQFSGKKSRWECKKCIFSDILQPRALQDFRRFASSCL